MPGVPLAIALSLAACGGTLATPTVHFQAKANAVCAEVNARLELAPPVGLSAESVLLHVRRTLPIIEGGLAALQQLTPPGGEEARYLRGLSALAHGIPLGKEALADLLTHHYAPLGGLAHRLNDLGSRSGSAFARIGLRQCDRTVAPTGNAPTTT
jgi:hypothetical protein